LRDLSLLMMELDSNLSFDAAYDQVTDLLSQHPDGDSGEVRALLEFEMVDALMEAEVRDEEDLIIEGMIRATRHGIIKPEEIPQEMADKVANRMQFQEEYAAESQPKNYMVHADIARIVNSAHRLERLQSMFSDYDEWFKSQLSVTANTLDSLADYLEDQESFIMGEIREQDESEYRRQMMSAETSVQKGPVGNFPKPAPFKGISYRTLLL
nr:hypothetical protein [Gammaproteobacteria bacterium]